MKNWKFWEHHDNQDDLEYVYYNLWEQTDNYACKNLKNDELVYFAKTTE